MSSLSKKMISVKEAEELRKRWLENQGAAIKKGMDLQDSSDFLFKLDDLQEYLDLVRKKSEDQGIPNPGVRIFFGAYEDDKKATVVLAPTLDYKDDAKPEEVKNNDGIEPLNTIRGGFPPFAY